VGVVNIQSWGGGGSRGSWSTDVTDRWTDGETCNHKTALCSIEHHAVKIHTLYINHPNPTF